MHSEDGDDELDLDSDENQAQPTTEKQQQQQQQQQDLPLSGTISPSYPECAQRSSVQQSPDTQPSRDLIKYLNVPSSRNWTPRPS